MDVLPERKQKTGYQKESLLNRIISFFAAEEKEEPFEFKSESELLMEGLKKAKQDWEQATKELDYVFDNEAVDYCTYKIKACEIKYEYLLKKVKKKNMVS